MNSQLRRVLQGPLGNYLKPKNKARLAMTNKGFYEQLKNNKYVKASIEYQQIKQAFFLRAFVREFLNLYDEITPGYIPRLLLDLSKFMVKRYNNLSNTKSKRNLLGSNAITSNDPQRLFLMFMVNLSIKLKKIDKILTNFIAGGVKKIRNLSKNKNHLLELLRNDYHFKSNPKAVYKTLTMVHYRSGQRGLTQRKMSGNRTSRIVRSMINGLKPLDYVQSRTWSFSEFSPIAQIVETKSFFTLLAPEVSKKSVKRFVDGIKLKKLRGMNVQRININNAMEINEPRWNNVIGRNFISLGNSSNSNNNVNNNRRTNNNSITKLRRNLNMSRKEINAFIAKEFPGFNKKINTVSRKNVGTLLKSRKAGIKKRTETKGKQPIWFKGNYSTYLQSKN